MSNFSELTEFSVEFGFHFSGTQVQVQYSNSTSAVEEYFGTELQQQDDTMRMPFKSNCLGHWNKNVT